MKIIIDGETDLLSVKDGACGETLIEQIGEALMSAHRIPVNYQYNGEEITEDDLSAKLQNHGFEAEDTLELTTTDLQEYLLNLLDQVSNGLSSIDEDLVTIADKMLKRDNREGLEDVAAWCREQGVLISNIILMRQMFNVDIDAIKLNNMSFLECVKKINDLLHDLNDKIQLEDRTAAADLLEFELAPLLMGLKGVIPTFKTRIIEVFNKPQ